MNNIDWSRTKRGIRNGQRIGSQFGAPLPSPIHPVFVSGEFGIGTVIPASISNTEHNIIVTGGFLGWVKSLFAGEGVPVNPETLPWIHDYNDFVHHVLIPENEYWSWYSAVTHNRYPSFGYDFGACVHGAFGSDVADAAIAYRHLWDPYVMATIRAMNVANQALINVSNSPTKPSSFTAKSLQDLGKTYQDEADSLLKLWNQFSGIDASTMTAESGAMIRAFQSAVKSAQTFWQDQAGNVLKPAGKEPLLPSPQAQNDVQGKIDRSGIMTQSDMSAAIKSMLPDFSDIHIPKWMYYAAGGVVILLGFAVVKGALTAAKFTPVGAALL